MKTCKVNFGDQYGQLTVIRSVAGDRRGNSYFLCLCTCGNEHKAAARHLLSGKIKSCGCLLHRHGTDHPNYGGYEELTGDYWNNVANHAGGLYGRNKIEFSVTIQEAWNLYLKQNRLCALSGLPIRMGYREHQTASLDRIDSAKGYTPDNVQWVHKDINRMKNTYGQDYFIDMCKKIAQFQERKT